MCLLVLNADRLGFLLSEQVCSRLTQLYLPLYALLLMLSLQRHHLGELALVVADLLPLGLVLDLVSLLVHPIVVLDVPLHRLYVPLSLLRGVDVPLEQIFPLPLHGPEEHSLGPVPLLDCLENGRQLFPLDELEEECLDTLVPLVNVGGTVPQALQFGESFGLEKLVFDAFWLVLEETPFDPLLVILFKDVSQGGFHKGY